MMSKERELLQRCLDEFEYKGVACNELCIDINKLLAKPERGPLSDEAIADLWDNKSPANEFECVRLVEKAHGIGSGE